MNFNELVQQYFDSLLTHGAKYARQELLDIGVEREDRLAIARQAIQRLLIHAS